MNATLSPTHTSSGIMRQVMLALIPGTLFMSVYFGSGILLNILVAVVTAVGIEAAVMVLRHRSPMVALRDGSAVLAGWLLALALPPLTPLWLTVLGSCVALLLGKHLYGGLGKNPFNPAMVGYAFLLVSFPKDLTAWIAPMALDTHWVWTDWLTRWAGNTAQWDIITRATPLDQFRAGDKIPSGLWVGDGWQIINAAFLAGGLYLLWIRVISWHIPITLLSTVIVLYGIDYTFFDSPFTVPAALFSGAMMLGAFFIATDPVTAATSRPGSLIYACGIGALVFVLRKWSAYPEAIAFAVLLMNTAAPAIDYYYRPVHTKGTDT